MSTTGQEDRSAVPAPPETFNFAQHLLSCNAKRATKAAFIDDHGTLSYGELDERVRRLASALKALGLRREERVLLLMQDGNDWPVSFLGALYGGFVPVAVNTLLTADDYAYMLEHSRAQAVLVSGALLPTLTAALTRSDHEVARVVVSRPVAPLHPSEVEFEAFLQAHTPAQRPARTGADDPAFWLYSSGSTGRPKGTVHSHANPYWTAELYGKAVLGLTESDVCFSAAKLFFAYGLGNGLSFPMSVGATTLLMAERPTPEATLVQHPAVLEAAVIGKEDGEGLTKTKAFVVLKSGESTTEEQLKAFVKDRLAPYKYPRFIEFVNDLPKTATGKIQRFRLREAEARRA